MTAKRQGHSLDAVRADGWFEKVAGSAPNFEQLCDAVGERYVAFALVAGVRITALAIDPRAAEQTQVTFCIGDQPEDHQMKLPEFRRCLTQALTQHDGPVSEPPEDMADVEAVQSFLGVRYVLLAAVFGVVPLELRVGEDKPPTVLISLGGVSDEVAIEEFREVIREAVRREERAAQPQRPFSIDLGRIPEAESALQAGDTDRVIELLEPWAGPLSMLLRTPQGQGLSDDAKASLARALGLLGTAYIEKSDYPTAEEVLRLGVQWVQDGPAAGRLFCELGRLALRQRQPGQAIGLFRRALTLEGEVGQILPLLAECFLDRDRAVAALVCVQDALEAGVEEADVAELRARALEKVRDPYEAWRKYQAVG